MAITLSVVLRLTAYPFGIFKLFLQAEQIRLVDSSNNIMCCLLNFNKALIFQSSYLLHESENENAINIKIVHVYLFFQNIFY